MILSKEHDRTDSTVLDTPFQCLNRILLIICQILGGAKFFENKQGTFVRHRMVMGQLIQLGDTDSTLFVVTCIA